MSPIALVFEDPDGTVGAVHDDCSTTYDGALEQKVDAVVDDVATHHGGDLCEAEDRARSRAAVDLFVEVPLSMVSVPRRRLRFASRERRPGSDPRR